MQQMTSSKILIVGTFRSGTNLLKFVLEQHFHTDVLFSEWFWKHGVPPTSVMYPTPISVPIVVVTKDPIAFNASAYNFWKTRRPELDCGRSISEFVRRRFIVYDNTGGLIKPKYAFPCPTDYWNQYHFSWLNWAEVSERLFFVQLEKLRSDPNREVEALASKLDLQRRDGGQIELPNTPVIPSQDGQRALLGQLAHDMREHLTDDDVAFIDSKVYQDVAQQLGYNV
jgi:hypothetical protein